MVTNHPLYLALKGYVVWGKQKREFVVKKYYKKPQEQSNVYPCGLCKRLIFSEVIFRLENVNIDNICTEKERNTCFIVKRLLYSHSICN